MGINNGVPSRGNIDSPPDIESLTLEQAKRILKPLGPFYEVPKGDTKYVSLSQADTSSVRRGGILTSVSHIGMTKKEAVLGILQQVTRPGEFVIRNASEVHGERHTFAWNGKKFVRLD